MLACDAYSGLSPDEPLAREAVLLRDRAAAGILVCCMEEGLLSKRNAVWAGELTKDGAFTCEAIEERVTERNIGDASFGARDWQSVAVKTTKNYLFDKSSHSGSHLAGRIIRTRSITGR